MQPLTVRSSCLGPQRAPGRGVQMCRALTAARGEWELQVLRTSDQPGPVCPALGTQPLRHPNSWGVLQIWALISVPQFPTCRGDKAIVLLPGCRTSINVSDRLRHRGAKHHGNARAAVSECMCSAGLGQRAGNKAGPRMERGELGLPTSDLHKTEHSCPAPALAPSPLPLSLTLPTLTHSLAQFRWGVGGGEGSSWGCGIWDEGFGV